MSVTTSCKTDDIYFPLVPQKINNFIYQLTADTISVHYDHKCFTDKNSVFLNLYYNG